MMLFAITLLTIASLPHRSQRLDKKKKAPSAAVKKLSLGRLERSRSSFLLLAASIASKMANDEFDFGHANDEDDLMGQVNEEDVRRMAEALAPQMSQLEDVLRGISEETDGESSFQQLSAQATNASTLDDDEDDDMDDELKQLAMSEQALRDELEFAHDINDLLSPSKDDEEEEDEYDRLPPPAPAPVFVTPTRQHLDPPEETKPPTTYTLQDHADHLRLRTEKMGGWYYCDMSPLALVETNEHSQDLVKDYCLPVPFRKLKRLYCGLMYHPVVSQPPKHQMATPSRLLASPEPTSTRTPRRTPVRTPGTPAAPRTPSTPAPAAPVPPEEPLPVRTVSIRIRPDVLCGATMDAVHHAFELLPHQHCTSHVLKRQGGHLRAGVYMTRSGGLPSLAYVVDAQLCTQKNEELERRLLLRFYHIQDDPEAMQELGQVLQRKQNSAAATPEKEEPSNSSWKPPNNTAQANRHMKQSCSLIQRLMAAQQQSTPMSVKQQASWLGLRDPAAFVSQQQLQSAVGKHLESNFKACPSGRD